MPTQRNIYLIGPMGAGKTAVGRQLARELGLKFIDSDAEIVRRTGVDIPYIFEKEGEVRFRQREKEVIADLTALDRIVLATGGGSILDPDNRRRLTASGTVLYLKTTITQQLDRTRQNRGRPLLASDDPRAVLEQLAAVRGPLYEELAAITIDTTGQSVRGVVADIRHRLRTAGLAPLQK